MLQLTSTTKMAFDFLNEMHWIVLNRLLSWQKLAIAINYARIRKYTFSEKTTLD